jgi:hypothetical protein
MSRLQMMLMAVGLNAALAGIAAAQARRSSADDIRRNIGNDTFRELMKPDRGNVSGDGPVSKAARDAALKQIEEDFKTIQDINNKMMADVWSSEVIDYRRTSKALSEIGSRATRLRKALVLPEPEDHKRPALTVTDLKEFKSSLMLMDRSLMSFVRNPIFRQHNVLEVNLAVQASCDLEEVIFLSGRLKKILAQLKDTAR